MVTTIRKKIQITEPTVGEEEWQAMREPLESGWLTQGSRVAEFEGRFAARHGTTHAVATTSCTTALHLVLVAMGVGPGDEVIVPAFTWVSTPNVVVYCGAKPVFVDVEPRSFNMDPARVAEAVTARTKVVLPVHLFGLCADVEVIRDGIPEHVAIVEDAACAVGAEDRGRPAGSLGLVGCFSFHPRKIITTGEGGMVTTNDVGLAERIRCLRNHGASVSEEQRHVGRRPYVLPEFNELGFNYRMTDLQGAIGVAQLSRLDGLLDERGRWAQWYREELREQNWLMLPEEPGNGRHAWQAFVTYVDPERAPLPRNAIMERLEAAGISTRPGTHAPPTLGYYRKHYQVQPADFPVASGCQNNTLALPLHNRMTADDYRRVVDVILSL